MSLTAHIIITLSVLVAGIVTIALCVWVEKRPRKSLTPSLVPTTAVMMVAALMLLLALIHLVNLLGLHTGPQT